MDVYLTPGVDTMIGPTYNLSEPLEFFLLLFSYNLSELLKKLLSFVCTCVCVCGLCIVQVCSVCVFSVCVYLCVPVYGVCSVCSVCSVCV